jgi:hypothetical protein
MHPILKRLAGSDRRSIGDADQVAQEIASDAELFGVVFDGMVSSEPVLRMRAADAIEKATRQNRRLLQPYKQRLLDKVAAVDQQEVRWHVAQMLPRLSLNAAERDRALATLESFLQDESKIVQVNAMQALADLVGDDEQLRERVIPILARMTETGSPAVKSRGRKLLKKLGEEQAA